MRSCPRAHGSGLKAGQGLVTLQWEGTQQAHYPALQESRLWPLFRDLLGRVPRDEALQGRGVKKAG